MPLDIRPFTESDLDAAAGLLAARHRADRGRTPELPARFEEPAEARAQVRQALARRDTRGVLATRDGTAVGFLLGSIVLPPPTAFWAAILAPRSVEMPYAGYAAAGADAAEVYRAMYAALAPAWLAAGCFAHFVEVHGEDATALDAWFSLGFGQQLTLAARTTDPLPAPFESRAAVEIHRASSEDIDLLMELIHGLSVHHAGPPIFMPLLPEATQFWRTYQLELLADPANVAWLAYQDGRPVGIQTFHGQTHAEMARPDQGVYLFEGYTVPGGRGTGVGTALLRHSMDWARAEGYAYCTLHVFSANIPGLRFWLRSGFRPLTHRLARRIDERIAWANGREEWRRALTPDPSPVVTGEGSLQQP